MTDDTEPTVYDEDRDDGTWIATCDGCGTYGPGCERQVVTFYGEVDDTLYYCGTCRARDKAAAPHDARLGMSSPHA